MIYSAGKSIQIQLLYWAARYGVRPIAIAPNFEREEIIRIAISRGSDTQILMSTSWGNKISIPTRGGTEIWVPTQSRGDGTENSMPTSQGGLYRNFNADLSSGGGTKCSMPTYRAEVVLNFEYQPIEGDGTEISIPTSQGRMVELSRGSSEIWVLSSLGGRVLKFQCQILEGDGTEIWVPIYQGGWHWNSKTKPSRRGIEILMPNSRGWY